MELQDKSGRIPAKIWYPQSAQYDEIKEETFVYISGFVDSYRENLQIIVQSLKVLIENKVSIEDFFTHHKSAPRKAYDGVGGIVF